MALTPEQRTTVLATVRADQTAEGLRIGGNVPALIAWLNTTAAPEFLAWRTRVTQDEIMQNGFDWVQVDNLSIGRARIWEWLFGNEANAINPSKANVRGGIDECWKGAAAMLAVRAAVYSHCRRAVSRCERVFATGPGTAADPGTAVFDGRCDEGDAQWLIQQG